MPNPLPSPPSAEIIRKALADFRLVVNDSQVLQIQRYMKMLLTWNDKVNLTAIHDPLEILYRHFCESMYASVAAPFEGRRLADLGSGGGFPGLPLKILQPGLEVFLVESNVKKATFLAEVIRDIGLKDVHVLVSRYEELSEELTPLDVVCLRAVGGFGPFLEWAASERIGAAQAILWIGGRDLEEAKKNDDWEWQAPIPVPQSLRRFLLFGKRKGQFLKEAVIN